MHVTPPFARKKHPATDKIDNITTGQLPLATYKLEITGRALLKQLKQQPPSMRCSGF